jgi:hypothetical protein
VRTDALDIFSVIAAAVQIAVGLILLQAAVGKVQRWREFKGILAAYQLLPHWAVSAGAAGVALVEFVTGLALVAAWRTPTIGVVAAGLFVVFAAAMAVNILRGRTSLDCGCFQSARQPLEWRLVFRNLMCAGAVFAASGFSLSIDDAFRWIHALPAGVALFAIYIAMNALWALDASRAAAFTRS